jgi:hypothetical protein
VSDFEHGTDRINLVLYDTPETQLGQHDMSFIGQSGFTASNQLRFVYQGGDTIVQGNLDTDALPEFEIQLTGHVTLTASDFIYF